MTPRDEHDRRSGDQRRHVDSVQQLVIELNDRLRDELLSAHGRVRDDILVLRQELQAARSEVTQWRAAIDKNIHDSEKAIMVIQTERRVETSQQAKQATFIALFVSALVTGAVTAFRGWLTGRP